jgi:two-component system, cell cycle sensor histidine kinase and response regulator CckA
VLVVDDEDGIRSVARRILERYGYRVLLASDGTEGLALHERHRDEIAVVLTDLSMPTMDGATMIDELRSRDPDLRVVASSGILESDLVDRARASGVSGFIEKPYPAGELLQVIRKAISVE